MSDVRITAELIEGGMNTQTQFHLYHQHFRSFMKMAMKLKRTILHTCNPIFMWFTAIVSKGSMKQNPLPLL